MMAAMTPDQALLLLGLDESSTWAEIRRAYRDKIRFAHPDAGGSFEPAASLNDAMAVLTQVYSSRVDNELVLVDDALVLVAPKSEVFDRLRAALEAVAIVVVVERASGVLIGELRDDLGAGRLVIEVRTPLDPLEPSTVQFTLDPIDARPTPRIDDVVRELARLLRAS
jgi:hypothetical protein